MKEKREKINIGLFGRLTKFLGDLFYDVSVKIHKKLPQKKVSMSNAATKKLLFYICIFALPVIQFLVFYVYVNINSIKLAFLQYGEVSKVFVGFANFEKVITELTQSIPMLTMLKNTVILFFATLVISIPLSLLVSYYLFKKNFGAKFFRVVLYLPSIISSLATVLAYNYFTEIAIPEIVNKLFNIEIAGITHNLDTMFGSVLFYTLWFGIGSSFMLYTSTMSSIPDSIIEAAQLDGVKPFQEFIYVIFPHIYNVFVTYVITNIAVMFINQMNLFSFFGYGAQPKVWTLGYYLYRETALASEAGYPYLSAFGITCTIVCIPLCFTSKFLLERFGPSTER